MINPRFIPNIPRVLIIDGLLKEDYYFGLYTAMHYWKITDAPTFMMQVITTRRKLSGRKLRIGTLRVQFIYISNEYFFGRQKAPYQGALVYFSDLEKTVADSAYFLGKHMLLEDLYKAIILAKQRLNIEKLIGYLKRFESPFMNQRLGYLLKKAGIKIEKNELPVSNRYVYLDPKGPKLEVARDKDWRIIINRKVQ